MFKYESLVRNKKILPLVLCQCLTELDLIEIHNEFKMENKFKICDWIDTIIKNPSQKYPDFLFRLKELKELGKTSSSLYFYEIKYGDNGKKLFDKKCRKCSHSKDKILKEKGPEYLKKYLESKNSIGKDVMIKRHGLENGTKMWNDYLIKKKISYEKSAPKRFLKYLDNFKKVHRDKYGYSKSIYSNNHTKIEIICPKHGSFLQKPLNHSRGEGCPICDESKGEKKVRYYLEDHNIKYEVQKRFKDCRNKNTLPFDFYLPDYNSLIEYDGKQHFDKTLKFYSDRLVENDKIKTNWAKKNKIKLIRIHYKKFNEIEKILEKKI